MIVWKIEVSYGRGSSPDGDGEDPHYDEGNPTCDDEGAYDSENLYQEGGDPDEEAVVYTDREGVIDPDEDGDLDPDEEGDIQQDEERDIYYNSRDSDHKGYADPEDIDEESDPGEEPDPEEDSDPEDSGR